MKYDFNKVINRFGTYSTTWDFMKDRFGKEDIIPFSISDMDIASSPEIIRALKKRIEHPIFGYSRWNHDDYKNAISKWFLKEIEFQIDEDWITYSPNVMFGISQLFDLLSNENDGIIIQTPAYDSFFRIIPANKRKLLENPLRENNGNFEIDFEHLDKLAKEAKILLFCSPQNPTGRVWRKDELIKIIDICRNKNVFIISDEIHMDIVYKPNIHTPILKVAGNYLDRTAIVTSASKSFNIPSLGGAYALIPNNDLIKRFRNNISNRYALGSPDIMGLTALLSAYNESGKWLEDLKKYLYENLIFIKDFLTKEMPDINFTVPEGTYLSWFDCRKLGLDDNKLKEILVEKSA